MKHEQNYTRLSASLRHCINYNFCVQLPSLDPLQKYKWLFGILDCTFLIILTDAVRKTFNEA